VADGVDVINLSVSGTQTNYLDPVEVAFFDASAAGVFVAVSAGNAGPANTVAHPSPWLMTVAASTDYKVQAATAALGNGANYGGYASSPYTPVSSSPLIDSQMAGPAGKDLVLVKQCWLGTLDTAMVGAPDPERFAYGAGHLNPHGAAVQGLVYDASPADYLRFLCGIGSLSPVSSYCTTFCSIPPWDLNLGSLTASSVVGPISLNRTVKNVTTASQPYNASASLPGFNVGVVPSSLTLAPGASDSFKVNLTRTTAPIGFYSFGNAASRP